MLKVVLYTEVDSLNNIIEKQLLEYIKDGRINKFEYHSDIYLMSFDWYNIFDVESEPVQIMIYFSKDNIIFICENESCAKYVKSIVKDDGGPDKTLFMFFSELIKNDIDKLEDLEERITDVEDELLLASQKQTGYVQENAEYIVAFRRELLRLKRYYEQLNHIFEELIENESNLINTENLKYFGNLDSKIDRLFEHVLNLRDYVTQVREAYQAQIDIEQNNIMKVFTVITSIFLPLTLIVGWYGMNLQMPEFNWKFGYQFVIIFSICVVLFSIVFFKRKKWF